MLLLIKCIHAARESFCSPVVFSDLRTALTKHNQHQLATHLISLGSHTMSQSHIHRLLEKSAKFRNTPFGMKVSGSRVSSMSWMSRILSLAMPCRRSSGRVAIEFDDRFSARSDVIFLRESCRRKWVFFSRRSEVGRHQRFTSCRDATVDFPSRHDIRRKVGEV